jgi:hypothetical protein
MIREKTTISYSVLFCPLDEGIRTVDLTEAVGTENSANATHGQWRGYLGTNGVLGEMRERAMVKRRCIRSVVEEQRKIMQSCGETGKPVSLVEIQGKLCYLVEGDRKIYRLMEEEKKIVQSLVAEENRAILWRDRGKYFPLLGEQRKIMNHFSQYIISIGLRSE